MIAMFGSNVRVEDATARTSSCTGLAVVQWLDGALNVVCPVRLGILGSGQVWKIT